MKLKYNFIAVGILTMLGSFPLFAQDECDAETFFKEHTPCLVSKVGKKCVQLDVRHNVDSLGKEFVYQWGFGDGNTKEGLFVDHCYENYGTYLLILDVIDIKNNTVVKNEFSTEITLIPPNNYPKDTLYHNMIVNLQYDRNKIATCRTSKIFWKIENEFYCGDTLEYQFKNLDFYLVEMGVIGRIENKEITGCGLKGILVQPENK